MPDSWRGEGRDERAQCATVRSGMGIRCQLASEIARGSPNAFAAIMASYPAPRECMLSYMVVALQSRSGACVDIDGRERARDMKRAPTGLFFLALIMLRSPGRVAAGDAPAADAGAAASDAGTAAASDVPTAREPG